MKKSLYTIYVMKIRKNNRNYKTSLVPYTNINNEKYLPLHKLVIYSDEKSNNKNNRKLKMDFSDFSS